MTVIVIRTDGVSGFFERAKAAARCADRGRVFDGKVTLSFEDPRKMFAVRPDWGRRLMIEVMHEPKTISELSVCLHRNRPVITKNVGPLERMGLIVPQRQVNPGHGFQKMVRSAAPKI